MKRMIWAWLGAAALIGPAGAGLAQDPGAPPPPPRGMGRMIEQRFAEMDANHDGAVTRDEYDAYRARMRAARMADRGGPPPTGTTGATGPGYDPNGGAAPAPGGPLGYDAGNGAGPTPPPGGRGMRGGRGMGPDWFARADLNGDGKVTLAEAQQAARTMMAERRAMRGQGGAGEDTPPPPPPQ